jgi:hypothetical protein
MGIYQRDNINYGGMLGNAMQNRARQIERDYDNYMRQPMAWANAVNQAGQAVSNAFNQAAQYQYNKDQLASQQQFQSEQNAMNRAQQLQMAREQQASTEKIAAMNRQASLQQQQAEKQAQNVMHYEISKGALDAITDEIMRTDDPTKLATLYRQRDEQLAKMNYYGSNLPDDYVKTQKYSDNYAQFGFKPGMGQKAETAAAPISGEVQTSSKPASVQYAEYLAAGNNAKTSAEIDQAIKNMSGIDRTFLSKQENEKFETDLANLQSKYEAKKKAEKNEADYQAALKAAGNNAFKRAEVKKKYGRK